ncbi:MAG: hypothetical protein GY720_12580 [bacterium]|nr:hypothetical protein [bacterium]
MSRAAFYQAGVLGEGPTLRIMRRLRLVTLVNLAGLSIDYYRPGNSSRAEKLVFGLLGLAFGVAAGFAAYLAADCFRS